MQERTYNAFYGYLEVRILTWVMSLMFVLVKYIDLVDLSQPITNYESTWPATTSGFKMMVFFWAICFGSQRLLRRSFWHPTMQERACVFTVLVVELRVDEMAGPHALPWLAHDLWLLVLEFLRRRDLGAPPLRAVLP